MPLIEIVPYSPSWPQDFTLIGTELRQILGNSALGIHHIGSTSVPGLPAKDVIDIQITVLELSDSIGTTLVESGFVLTRFQTDHCPPGQDISDAELAKLLFNGKVRRSNIHVRVEGRFNQRYPLLCRDYLRAKPEAANAYGAIKVELARYFPDDVNAYYDIKDPVFDVIMAGADEWARFNGWVSPPTDA